MLREVSLGKVSIYFGIVASHTPYCFVQYVQEGNIGSTRQEIRKAFLREEVLAFIDIHNIRLTRLA
ncbi:MAG: hypothetical protein Q7J38_03560 [Gallionella sp.]|nr:hypothetical protein [Gallionella sp.]